ncbi:hypothetical protein C8J55DRAFT_185404 [Lentinula edodes]|uniref:DUF726-domain-containing protein n=1 Tax=Lentinula lateritia TaxID=40482 RepID=A0A9W8ZZT0_9AGAR|nr:hypothetical protein C8J55DRAFT_185404 [Lentinula edodes]
MSNPHRLSTTTTASSFTSTTLPSSSKSSSSTLTPSSPIDKFPPSSSIWDSDSDSDGWQDMPIVHTDELRGGLDEEDQRRYHYRVNEGGSGGKGEGREGREGREGGGGEGSRGGGGNATGTTLDTDEYGYRWRSNPMQSNTPSSSTEHSFTTESNYTRLRHVEEDWEESASVVTTSRYLFHDHYALEERGPSGGYGLAEDDGKAITPLSQMQQTKGLLSESQRIAYVGLCAVVIQDMIRALSVEETTKVKVKVKQGDGTVGTEVRVVPRKVKGRDGVERGVVKKEVRGAVGSMEVWALKILGRLYYHIGVEAQEQSMIQSLSKHGVRPEDLVPPLVEMKEVVNPEWSYIHDSKMSMSGEEEEVPKHITVDMRYTLLTDLFLILIADSVYDSRSRSLLFRVGSHLSLSWWDIVVFEGRIVEAVGAGEGVGESGTDSTDGGLQKSESAVADQVRRLRNRRIALLGLATLGGGLVIGLSAGLLAPVIGVGLGTAFSTIGLTGASTFLAGSAGAAVITTGGVLTGAGIASKGMIRRTQLVRVFDVLPVHQNQRVSCILCVPGFLNGALDDPRLPFSVLDPVGGDVCAVLWEPEMIRETGGALGILTGEVISQIGQTVLQATVMGALMTALQWPIILTKLGYLIDNPWSNALDRARAAGLVLASVLRSRQLGVRPITLIGFSLGARVIFYALLELAKSGGYGIVQDVFLLGATLSVSPSLWAQTRSVVGGRYVNAYARNDWVLNYLFRASSAASGEWGFFLHLFLLSSFVPAFLLRSCFPPSFLLSSFVPAFLLRSCFPPSFLPSSLLPPFLLRSSLHPSFLPSSLLCSFLLFAVWSLFCSLEFCSLFCRVWRVWEIWRVWRVWRVSDCSIPGNVNTVAGLRPIEGVQGLENVDVTDKIAGHMSYRVYMPVILEELGFKVTERWFDEVEEPDFEGDRVVLPSSPSSSSNPSTSPDSTNPSTSPDTDPNTNTSNLSWFARRKAKAAAQKEREQRRKEAEQKRSVAGVQRPPSYASWVGKEGKEKEKAKMSLDDEELPPREGTPPIRTASPSGSIVGSVHPTVDLSSRSSTPTPTPTPTPNSNTSTSSSSSTTTTTSTSATTPLVVPLNSDHIASPLPKTAGFDFAAIKAELRELSKGVEGVKGVDGIVPAFEAPRVRVDNKEGIEEEKPEEEFGPLSSSSSSPPPTPPTPPSKSPNAGYFSFPPTTSTVLTASPYNNNNNASSVSLSYNPFATPTATTASTASSSTGFAATPTTTSNSTSTSNLPDFGSSTTTTTGLTFGSADGSRITGSAGIGLPDPYLPDPWTVPSSSSRKGEDVGNPWG